MQTSGFASTPTTLLLLLLSTTLSLLASITNTKHHLPLSPYPHLYPYLQLHRLLTHQLAYTSSTDLLFSSVLLYHLRVLERLFGTRKFVSFVLVCGAWEAVVAPLALAVVVRPLSWGKWDHVPAGMHGVVMAALAVWAQEVPTLWRWELVVPSLVAVRRRPPSRRGRGAAHDSNSSSCSKEEAAAAAAAAPQGRSAEWTLTFSDKTPTYLLALQLSLTQFPHALLPATTGYLIGRAWHGELLPARLSACRVPRWMVGEAALFAHHHHHRTPGVADAGVERERYEALRRRLEEEGGRGADGDGMRQAAHAHATATARGEGDGQEEREARRRPIGAQIADYFRGVF